MVRGRRLPSGWYPAGRDETRRICDDWSSDVHPRERTFLSAIVPHAGWTYSGQLACATIARLKPADTVVVVGGHLREADPIMVAGEDAVATPLGDLRIDAVLRSDIVQHLRTSQDSVADNTVEIQLPFVAGLFRDTSVLCVRCPPSGLAGRLGEHLADHVRRGRSIAVVGSTDLTHYGPAYRFEGHGDGQSAVRWVRDRNDRAFIDTLAGMDPDEIVAVASRDRSACSAGAAAVAAAFARSLGARESEVVGYHTSYDVSPNASFVGYVGLGYRPDSR